MSQVRIRLSDVRIKQADVRIRETDARIPLFDFSVALSDVRVALTDIGIGFSDVSIAYLDVGTAYLDVRIALTDVIPAVSDGVGIEEQNGQAGSMSVYPNPNKGSFNLNITGITNNVELSMTNLQGQVIYNEELNINTNYTKPLDISSYPKGIYFFKLTGEDVVRVEKVIIQ